MSDLPPIPADILVVDDTVENLRLLASLLEGHGYQVRPVPSGRLALQAVQHAPPDLILLDVNMPELNGYEVCRRLRDTPATRDIPVIFLSALSDTADKVHGFEEGGVDYVTKPFQFEEVLARVRTHVALRRARRDLAESYERLRALEQLRDKLVHMVAHDLRSPLAVITGYLELLRMDSPGENAGYVEGALDATQVLNRMIQDLLDVSRLEDGKMPLTRAAWDLAEMARDVADKLGRTGARREVQVESAGTVSVVCDGPLVRRVLENLVGNGIKHTPAGTPLRIELRGGPGPIRVTVCDEGPGVPLDAQEKIFEKFVSLALRKDHAAHSAGLGLAFCKLAVEAHGGTIGVDSGERGSAFWFELPG